MPPGGTLVGMGKTLVWTYALCFALLAVFLVALFLVVP